jgi:hydrogenase maturation protein HypF
MDEGRRISVSGIVQGVGFRPWVYRLAAFHGLTGWIRNVSSGVTIETFGPAGRLEAFLDDLRATPPPAALIRSLACTPISWLPFESFTIESSETSTRREVSIPADLATCQECLAEIRDPADRRYRYAFTNCTNCGPRYTIAQGVPYDRASTTMAGFTMCAACQREYDDPSDRRFHAQPNACPSCGPRLSLADGRGRVLDVIDPLTDAAAALCAGRILALKGLGGFHLACDATNREAVETLRSRKRRDEKPFAVMVADLSSAQSLALLGVAERDLLCSIERPIVLAPRRPQTELVDSVAPRNDLIGVMLPYTPLHHLLLDLVRRPLVMTSGNLSEEPLAYRDHDAFERLSGIADIFLIHDRPIETPCDDSVARVIAARPVVFRRSRGFVPRAIGVDSRFARRVLGCGALLKNTFCLARDRTAYLGPHIGDLEHLETVESFRRAIMRLEQFLDISPEIVAYDLHPEYLSTRYALGRSGVAKVGVQHHHAHVASAMAEHGLSGPVLGVAYDGTGLGTDGTAWGGEVLLADFSGFRRLATWRPIALAGGDMAIRQVWRQAFAAVFDAFDGTPPIQQLPVFSTVPASELAVVRQMLEKRLHVTPAHGIGRYFDAAGALGLVRPYSRFEGQVALEWNLIAHPAEQTRYDVVVGHTGELVTVDARPMIRAMVEDLIQGRPTAVVSARFHNTIAGATVDLIRLLVEIHGPLPVVLTGGCFQNARLAERVASDLRRGLDVYLHGAVPPGDGGLSLGQVMIANAAVQSGRLDVTEDSCAWACPGK